MKYSEKQKYRRYKTKTEPKLHNKIMIDEEDDIVNTIKKAFGIEDKKKTNYSSPETSGAPHYEEPNPIEPEEPIVVPKYKTTEDPKPNVAQEREIIPRARTTSIATEITSEIASPSPISPGKLIALQALEKGKKRNKMQKQAEAEERSKKERERLQEKAKELVLTKKRTRGIKQRPQKTDRRRTEHCRRNSEKEIAQVNRGV